MADVLSLEEFAAQLASERERSWADSLPPEVQEQIITTTQSVRTTVAWLHRLGYDEATDSKLDHWRRKKRAERARGKR